MHAHARGQHACAAAQAGQHDLVGDRLLNEGSKADYSHASQKECTLTRNPARVELDIGIACEAQIEWRCSRHVAACRLTIIFYLSSS